MALLPQGFAAIIEVVLVEHFDLVEDRILPLKAVDDQWVTGPHIEELVDLGLKSLLLLLALSI